MNIIIVDNEPLALSRLQRLLTTLGHTSITHALSASEALEHSRTKTFDLAILDISMSDMDGIELEYALRYAHEEMAIIYQIAHENYALKVFDLGAVDYLLKPYTSQMLERSLQRVDVKKSKPKLRLISKAGDAHYLLHPEDIFYVKADLSEVILQSMEGFSYYPKKISDVSILLESHGFLQIHRSYIINLNAISEMGTIDQSHICFSFSGIKETIESSKDGVKQFRHLFKGSNHENRRICLPIG